MQEQEYPDVLGAITSRERLELENLQCVLGVFPAASAVGQPFEALILLQSVIDQPQEVTLDVQLPRGTKTGHLLSFFIPKRQVKLTLGPGEVSALYLPVMAQPPTPPMRGFPLIVDVKAKPLAAPRRVRPLGSGRPPSILDVSPFKLEVLSDVSFSGKGPQAGQLQTQFDVIPGKVRPDLFSPSIKQEILWKAQDFQREQSKIAEVLDQADQVSLNFTRNTVFYHVEQATRERFAEVGLPLHPGESHFIAKSITYVYEDGLQLEAGFTLHEGRWFQWLCSLLAREPATADRDPGELAVEFYPGAVYDAVRVGLSMVASSTGQSYGSGDDHRQYAEKVLLALQGGLPMDISYAYLPLVMSGVLLNLTIRMRDENLWESLDMLDEARRGRSRLMGRGVQPILVALDDLVASARQILQRSRIPRP